MSRSEKWVVTAVCIAVFSLFISAVLCCTTGGVALKNIYVGQIKEVDNLTNYKTQKQIEDTCRAMIVSYSSDKIMYNQYKDSDSSEERSWASAAKIRANKTAVLYNEYILKNNYLWNGNIPSDIRSTLDIIEQ